jgi:hypothetical protein
MYLTTNQWGRYGSSRTIDIIDIFSYMKSRSPASRVHTAIRKAIREAEEDYIRVAYLAQADSEVEADDWSNAEEWKPERIGTT